MNILLNLANLYQLLMTAYKLDENLIKGCQSKVWLYSELENDTIKFTADSDAILTKGIVALLLTCLFRIKNLEIF